METDYSTHIDLLVDLLGAVDDEDVLSQRSPVVTVAALPPKLGRRCESAYQAPEAIATTTTIELDLIRHAPSTLMGMSVGHAGQAVIMMFIMIIRYHDAYHD